MIQTSPSRPRAPRRVVTLTGAGVSAESGVPTFRDAGGLWRGHEPQRLATPEAFDHDPVLVWEFYDWRRCLLAECRPNPAHQALARLEDAVPESLLVTQNVDGLHRLAGCRRLAELHGDIWELRCRAECGASQRQDRTAPLPRPLPPKCECGAPLRPGVVWFGEALPEEPFERACRAAAAAELFLVAGTSGVVEPAASLARIAGSNGAWVIEINPEATPLSVVADETLRAPAAKALPQLVEEICS